MTSIAVSRRAETSSLSFIQVVLNGLRRRRLHALLGKQTLDDNLLLMGLDHQLLLDLGFERLNGKCGKF